MTKQIRYQLVRQERTATSVMHAAGVTEATWYHRMRHPRSWRLGELERVASALGMTVAELVGAPTAGAS